MAAVVDYVVPITRLEYARLSSFVIWTVVMGAVIGSRAANTGNLFNQTSFWDLYFKRVYRKFTDPGCDRSASGCPSTIEFAVPQNEISGVTVFMWLLIAPLAAFAYQAAMIVWYRRKNVAVSYRFRAYNEVAYALFILTELFLLAYLRSAAGDTVLSSYFGFAGVWVALRYHELMSSDTSYVSAVYRFNNRKPKTERQASVSTIASEVESGIGAVAKGVEVTVTEAMGLLDTETLWEYPVQNAFKYMIVLAAYAFMWTAYFLPIGTAWAYGSNTRYSYTLAHWLFFMFHLLETEFLWSTMWLRKGFDMTADVAEGAFNKFTRNYYVYSYSVRFAFWMAKIMTTALLLFWWDVATATPVVQFNLLA